MAHFHNNALIGASGQGGYQIERSLRFNSADSAYLSRTPASAGNRKTWTWSGWVKRSKLGAFQRVHAVFNGSTIDGSIRFNDTDTFQFTSFVSSIQANFVTTQVFRDVSAWYHIVVSVDTTQATSSDRIKIYLNGTQISTFSTSTYPSSSADLAFNTTTAHYLGQSGASTEYLDGYLTEVHFIDGQALTPSSFGETDTITGVWKPKKYAGTYGTNGFYLKFADNSGTTSTTLGKDSSGNGNNWTPNNFSVTAGAGNDSLIDTPTPYADGGNGRGNYCTFNPLANAWSNTGSGSTADGNLYLAYSSGNWYGKKGTIAVSSGKWYYEWTNTSGGTASQCGFTTIESASETGSGVYRYRSIAEKVNTTYSSYGATWSTAGDIIGVALDIDGGTITFYKNGTSQGTAFSSIPAGTYIPECVMEGAGYTGYANFGQRAFAYTPPSGFLALNTQNLPEPSIKKPERYVNAQIYTGTGAALTINTTIDPTADALIWTKMRSAAGIAGWDQHFLVDSKRIYAGNKYWQQFSTNNTSGESANGDIVQSYTTSSITKNPAGPVVTNESGKNYVMWSWQATASAGFDIVTYTGTGVARTIAHSLGVAPSMMIVKNRSLGTESWRVYHQNANASPATGVLNLNTTAAFATSSTQWNNTAPTSSVFSVGTDDAVNRNGDNYVAYLWSEVAGFSKFGSYTGNGSSDGPFVFCGFRPRWVMLKRSSDTGGDWHLFDSSRGPYNPNLADLFPNDSSAEYSSAGTSDVDFLSNGFKIRDDWSGFNNSGSTFIFAAFAESPQKYSLAR